MVRWMGEDFVGALCAVRSDFCVDADLLQVPDQNLLVDWVVLDEEDLVSLVPDALLDVHIILFLALDHLRGARAIQIDTQVAFVSRVENDRESRRLHRFVYEVDPFLHQEMLVF